MGKSRSSSIITATIQDEDSIEPSDDVEDTDPQVEEEDFDFPIRHTSKPVVQKQKMPELSDTRVCKDCGKNVTWKTWSAHT